MFDGEDRLWITGGPLEGAGAGEVQVAVLHPAALDLGSQVPSEALFVFNSLQQRFLLTSNCRASCS